MTLGLMITAAGLGKRFGDTGSDPFKVLATLKGKPVIVHTVMQFSHISEISQCIITVAPGSELVFQTALKDVLLPFPITIVTGGETRQQSVYNGISAMTVDKVLIHDGARPCVPSQVIQNLLSQQAQFDGIIPVIPVVDTIKQLDSNGMVVKTPSRSTLCAVQTPQLVTVSVLKEAYQQSYSGEFTDDSMLLEKYGCPIKTVPGDNRNIKLTYPEDLQRLEKMMDSV